MGARNLFTPTALLVKAKKLSRNNSGSFAIMGSVWLSVIIGFAGLALDGSRLYYGKQRLQDTVDVISLAVASDQLDSQSELNLVLKSIFRLPIQGIRLIK